MEKNSEAIQPKQIDLMRVQINKMELVPIENQMGLGESSYILTTEESLVMNREAETISMGQKNSLGSDVVQYFHVPDGLPALMDRCQAHMEDLTARKEDFQADLPSYMIEMIFNDNTGIEISGLFHENALPVGWPEFAQEIAEFIEYHAVKSLLLQPHKTLIADWRAQVEELTNEEVQNGALYPYAAVTKKESLEKNYRKA